MNIPYTTSTQYPLPLGRPDVRVVVERAPAHRILRSGRTQGSGSQFGVFGAPGVLGTLGFAGLALASWLALIMVTADSFRVAGNSPEGQHHRRITLFNEEVRAAAANLELDRSQCEALQAQPRRVCQKEALSKGRVALKAARQRYEDSSAATQIAQP
jgi:hypothetical protein